MKKAKILCTVAALLFLQQTYAQQHTGKHFTLSGNLSGKQVDSVILGYEVASNNIVHLSGAVKSGRFTLTGDIAYPVDGYISFKNKNEIVKDDLSLTRQIMLDPAVMAISGDPSNLSKLTITGSVSQVELEDLNTLTQPYYDKMKPIDKLVLAAQDKWTAAIKNKADDKTIDSLKFKTAALDDEKEPYYDTIKRISYKFSLAHPNSYVTVLIFQGYLSRMGLDSSKTIYNNFNAELKQNIIVKQTLDKIKEIEVGLPGNKAADFSSTELNGKQLSLAGFKGKYVMLDFWASWCVPCRKSNPHMIELYNKYKDKGFDVIGISDDDYKPDAWKGAVNKDNVGIWHNVLRGFNMDMLRKNENNPNDLNRKFGIHTIPTKILIDPNGKIVGRYGDSFGGTEADMDKMLASIFNK
jgi:thiol-disulfide isomerase/thioredoxin